MVPALFIFLKVKHWLTFVICWYLITVAPRRPHTHAHTHTRAHTHIHTKRPCSIWCTYKCNFPLISLLLKFLSILWSWRDTEQKWGRKEKTFIRSQRLVFKLCALIPPGIEFISETHVHRYACTHACKHVCTHTHTRSLRITLLLKCRAVPPRPIAITSPGSRHPHNPDATTSPISCSNIPHTQTHTLHRVTGRSVYSLCSTAAVYLLLLDMLKHTAANSSVAGQ